MKPVLIHLRPLNRKTNARVDVYVGDGPNAEIFGTAGAVAPGGWEPAITMRPQLSIELFSMDMDGKVQTGRCRFDLALRQIRNVAAPEDLYWKGAAVVIYSDGALEGPTAVPDFDGYITSAALDSNTGKLQIQAEVSDTLIDKPLLIRTFTGGGGIDGDAGKRGVFLPAGFGSVKNMEPVWFDLTRNIGMIDGYGNTISIDWLGEGLNSFDASVADYPSYAALAAAVDAKAIPPGRWATCVAEGLVALGAPPVGVITVHAVFGANRSGAWMRRILEIHAEVPLGKVDTAAFDQLDLDLDLPVHWWTADQRNVKDLLEAIARPCLATPLISFQGKVTVTRAVQSAPVLTLDRTGGMDPRVRNWRAGAVDAPFYRIAARAARPARVLSFDEVNFRDNFDPKGVFKITETYRAGNLVWLDDGSEWLYINDAPAAGHEPPVDAPPDINGDVYDDWWFRLQPPSPTAKIVRLVASGQTFKFDADGNPDGQTIRFTVSKQNTTNQTYWTLTDKAGTVIADHVVAVALAATGFFTCFDDDTIAMSQAQFVAFIAGTPDRETFTLRAEVTDGNTFVDEVTVSKLQDGATGNFIDIKWKVSDAQPATPVGDDPAGWLDAYPTGGGTVWLSRGPKDKDGHLIDVWSTPGRTSGLVNRQAYDNAATYYLDNVVTAPGGTYIAVQDNFSGFPPSGTGQPNAHWDVLAPQGDPGTPATPPSGFTATLNLPAGAAINLRTIANANGYTGLSDATITFRVPNGVTIMGLSSGIGIDTGTWPAGYAINLSLVVQNGGIVYGGGGNGGIGGGSSGSPGGDAIYCRENLAVTIDAGGVVKGAGGGGGGGDTTGSGKLGGGGGGGGAPNGIGGSGDVGSISTGADGNDATVGGGGAGGAPRGGAGGAFATAGTAGATGGGGGAAGFALRKNGKTVPVTNNGTMTGAAA